MVNFSDRLLTGETVIWWGRPGQGLRLTPLDGVLIPFSLMWCGFAVFWEITVLRSAAPGFFAFWGLPFIAIGIYFVIGRFLVDAWARANTYYAVTNRRILIARSGPFGRFVALSRDRLPEMHISESSDGRGTIRFGQQATFGTWGRSGFAGWTPALDSTPQFIAIDDVRNVFNEIQSLIPGGNSVPTASVDRHLTAQQEP